MLDSFRDLDLHNDTGLQRLAMNDSKAQLPHNIQAVLDQLYPDPPVPLDHSSDFTFLVAVVLSAQTTDGKVNEVTKVLFKHADTPEALARMDVTLVLDIIRPVGLAPKKAENIVKLSKMLVEKFGSKVPATYEELESLPGVGHKTASVIMSQVHSEPQIAVDTHVHRLALRWGLSKDSKNVDNVQRDLCGIFPKEHWNKLHLQMIYFGREYCTAKNHENAQCPICSWIHKKGGAPPPTFHHFESKKPTKGIVYYADRHRELLANPALAFHSPHKVAVVKEEVITTGTSRVGGTGLLEATALVAPATEPLAVVSTPVTRRRSQTSREATAPPGGLAEESVKIATTASKRPRRQ